MPRAPRAAGACMGVPLGSVNGVWMIPMGLNFTISVFPFNISRVILLVERFWLCRPNSEVLQYHSKPSLLKHPLNRFSVNLHEATAQNQLVEAVAGELLVILESKSGFRHPS
jgi:hypothetical protein